MADEEKKAVPKVEILDEALLVSQDQATPEEVTDNSEVTNPAESKQDVSEAENADEEKQDVPEVENGDEEKKDVPEDEDPDVQKGVSPKVRDLVRRDKRKLTAQQKRRERLREVEQEIANLQEKQKQLAEELSQNRTQCRNSCVFTMYNMILRKFNLVKKEKAACTEDEFDALLKEVETIIDKILIDHLKFECMVPGLEEVCEQLELKDKLDACKTKDDYPAIYKKVNKRLKALLAAEAKLKAQFE